MGQHSMAHHSQIHTFFQSDVNKTQIGNSKHMSLLIINRKDQDLMDTYRHMCLTNCLKIDYCSIHPYMFLSTNLPMNHLGNEIHIILSRSLRMLVMGIHLHKIVKVKMRKILMDIHLNRHYEFSFGMKNSKLSIFRYIYVLNHLHNLVL